MAKTGRCTLFFLFMVFSSPLSLITADDSDIYACPEGWFLRLQSCYRWGSGITTYRQAKSQCQKWGGSLRVIRNSLENNLFTDASGPSYWLGIDKIDRRSWQASNNMGIIYEPPFMLFNSDDFKKRHRCAVWFPTRRSWRTERCQELHRFLCQRQPDCSAGWFGPNCSRQCRCRGSPCNSIDGVCRNGCQLGWMGPSCDIEKLNAIAQFYCFKIQNDNMMLLRVDQRNTTYRSVIGVDKGGNSVRRCDWRVFEHFESGGTAILKVKEDNGSFMPSCGESKTSDEKVSWRFKFQEYPSSVSAYDVLFEATCDFSMAETLHRLATTNSEKPSNKTTTLKESKESVSFDVIDPFNNLPVTTAKLGQYVRVQMALNNVDELGVSAISPYNCSVSSSDSVYIFIFSDQFGCTPVDAQIKFQNTTATAWQTELFETFTFAGYDQIIFQCDVHVCFEEEKSFCQNMCSLSKARNQRTIQTRSIGDKLGHSSTTMTTLSVG